MKALTVLLLVSALAEAYTGELPWAKDYEAAQVVAKKEKKLIMVDFYTDWCGWCKKLDKDTYPDPKVGEAAKQFAVVKTNAEKEGKDLAKKHHVAAFPTIVFLTSSGEEVANVPGYQPPADFLRLLNNVAKIPAELGPAKAAIDAGKGTGEDYAKVVVFRALQGAKADELEPKLDKAVALGYGGPYLVQATLAVGDALQNGGKNKEALAKFAKALELTEDPGLKSYALISTMFTAQALKDAEGAKKAAQELVALPGATKEWVEIAKPLAK